MLPTTKRRSLEDAVTVAKQGSPKSHRAPKPEVFEESPDSVTRMMPAKYAGDFPAPPSSRPAVQFARPNSEMTVIRPMSERPAALSTFPRFASDTDKIQAQIKAVRAARVADKAPDSDPRIDPPASTVTANHLAMKGKPTASWAMALVAMGLFGGLVTAVLVRGDGDAIVAAGAAFVDPGQAAQISAAHDLQPLQHPMIIEAPAASVVAEVVPTEVVAAVPAPVEIQKPAPVVVAAAAPVARPVAPVVKAAPKPAVAAAPVQEKAADKPVVAAAPKAAKPAKPGSAASDLAGATAADALAKAQIEASLQ